MSSTLSKKKYSFNNEVLKIAIPVTLQYVFQAILSFINQLMVGQLGDVNVAACGLGNAYANLFIITVTSISTAATILIAQYYGKRDKVGVSTSFFFTSVCSVAIMLVFTVLTLMFPYEIMSMYTKDPVVCAAAAGYLQISAIGFIPLSLTWIISGMLRSVNKCRYPMYAGVISIFLNIIANYLLIFGNFGFPKLGLNGSAMAISFARFAEFFILLIFFAIWVKQNPGFVTLKIKFEKRFTKKVFVILVPILITEFLWVLGNNVYMMIYGHVGTSTVAAISLTDSVQLMSTNLLMGIATAAGVIVGNRLGRNKYDGAYKYSKKLLYIGFIVSVIISVIVVLIADFYSSLFNVSPEIQNLTRNVLYVFAAFLFVKMLNMILASIIRAGGSTTAILVIDTVGAWAIGIPLGLMAALLFDWDLILVYIFISIEEVVRFIAMLILFKRKKWMKNLTPDVPQTIETSN